MVRLTLIYALISHGTASARSSRFRGSGNQPKDEISRKDVLLHHVTSYFVLLYRTYAVIISVYHYLSLELFDKAFY